MALDTLRAAHRRMQSVATYGLAWSALAQVSRRRRAMPTDMERLDWLERSKGPWTGAVVLPDTGNGAAGS